MQKSPFLSKFHVNLRWKVALNWIFKTCHQLCTWQHWKNNLKVNIVESHPACVSSRRTKGKFVSYIADSRNLYQILVLTSSEKKLKKKRSSSLKISSVCIKNLPSDENGNKTACLVATRWPCVTLGLIAFHGGVHATLSSWGDKAPAVTHHQQRNIIAKRWAQKRAEEE